MKKFISVLTILFTFGSISAIAQEYYEIRTYYMKFGGKLGVLENYISKALIPALNKQGVTKVGVFKDLGKPEPAVLVLVIPFQDVKAYVGYKDKLNADVEYNGNARSYFDLVGNDKPMFERISTYFGKAFDGFKSFQLPTTSSSRIYEWRTYEAYNEDALRRKIQMFNDEELKIFDKVGLHNVFFAEVLAGENTPCFSYMVSFDSMKERDENWAKFSADPDWKRIVSDPKYANSHSRTVRRFLEPTAYSQW